jgi:plastocyanin
MTKAPRLLVLAAALPLALGVIAGCGDDDDSSSTEASSTTSTESTTTAASQGGGGGETLAVSETDYALDPADPTVTAGTVTIEATNDGQTTHSIEVEGPSGEQELEQDLAPGDSGTLEVDLSKPGTYEWYCPVGNHKEMGMEGEITVE